MWIAPIYDRTSYDVQQRTEKGYLNIEDLNRIEGNIQFLAETVGASVSTITWTHDTLPTINQFDRILNNITSIKNSWSIIVDDNPQEPINTYEKVNTIEKILFDIYKNWHEATDALMRCGGGYCGNYDIL